MNGVRVPRLLERSETSTVAIIACWIDVSRQLPYEILGYRHGFARDRICAHHATDSSALRV